MQFIRALVLLLLVVGLVLFGVGLIDDRRTLSSAGFGVMLLGLLFAGLGLRLGDGRGNGDKGPGQ
jgi:uncharacterized membrane protein YiaA